MAEAYPIILQNKITTHNPIIVVGGGIAGVSCAESLSVQNIKLPILLVSGSPVVKRAVNIRNESGTVLNFDIEELSLGSLTTEINRVKVLYGIVTTLIAEHNAVTINNNFSIRYSKLCICTGATPQLIGDESTCVYGIRDTDSVELVQAKLRDSRRVVIVGNGGIALELVYKIKGTEVVWVIRDNAIGSVFLDKGAAQFMLSEMGNKETRNKDKKGFRYIQGSKGNLAYAPGGVHIRGSALGPDWTDELDIDDVLTGKNIRIEYNCEIKHIQLQETNNSMVEGYNREWPVHVLLTNSKIIECDMVVSATGVQPNVYPFSKDSHLKISTDGGIIIDEEMRTSLPNVYAAGDACTVNWTGSAIEDNFWFQMRLWTQALQMGNYAGKCIASHLNDEYILQDFCFELFTHSTKFFGHKVILLGNFHAAGLDKIDVEFLLRYGKGDEYIKIVLFQEKMVGAVLIGETGLEEMCENLILNQLNLTDLKDNILNPDIDMEGYFD
ncbi:Pyridine nucleotide-disulfide oxidoreductase domain-containing protein 1-like isoform X2 [Oopsacas minuta]|uniref:Pyridine nucleotide-disulfide oxidoreductase domain-containing protein 1 n=1 Tax=Oopsacas minuta TaxID=111878 RepID=A0AAV7JDI6_9METZ|nr:Pyridine nucleotide-disulfide oxidoreductase domain-containing protein 1-like isoform X2 [Oopsacas minuta]